MLKSFLIAVMVVSALTILVGLIVETYKEAHKK